MEDNDFMESKIFCNKVTFHVSRKVKRHNSWMWGTQNPHEFVEYEHGSSKINSSAQCQFRNFMDNSFSAKKTVTGPMYSYDTAMVVLQMLGDSGNSLFQHDGGPLH